MELLHLHGTSIFLPSQHTEEKTAVCGVDMSLLLSAVNYQIMQTAQYYAQKLAY